MALAPRNEKVLIVGAGGLGCPASLALAIAGIRRMTLIDPDSIDATNLHRQPWYRTQDVGSSKVAVAARRLRDAFPGIEVEGLASRVDASNVIELLSNHDLTIDGTDSIATKFLLSDAAVIARSPVVYGGVLRMAGQVMVLRPGGPCLRCLFEDLHEDDVPTCAQAGVLGSVAGLIGALQVQAGLHWLSARRTGPEELLAVFDAERLVQRNVRVSRAKDCPSCGEGAQLRLREPEAPGC